MCAGIAAFSPQSGVELKRVVDSCQQLSEKVRYSGTYGPFEEWVIPSESRSRAQALLLGMLRDFILERPGDLLLIIRGLPGSGKSYLARQIVERYDNVAWFEADKYPGFWKDDVYCWQPSELGKAHSWCNSQLCETVKSLDRKKRWIFIVSNTVTQRWELTNYEKIAHRAKVPLKVIDLFDGGQTDSQLADGNDHGVSLEKICQMRNRYERGDAFGNGDTRPPWGRGQDKGQGTGQRCYKPTTTAFARDPRNKKRCAREMTS